MRRISVSFLSLMTALFSSSPRDPRRGLRLLADLYGV